LTQRDVTSGTTNSSPVGTEVVDLGLDDRRYQASGYYLNYTGASPEADDLGDPNGSLLIYEDNAGDTKTVSSNEQLLLKPRVPVATIKTVLGLDDAEIDNIWGAGSSSKKFLGLLTTVLGYVVRTITILTTVTRIGFAIKREFESTDDAFLRKIQFNDFFVFARSGVHPGHALVLTSFTDEETKRTKLSKDKPSIRPLLTR
jgi:hypothetical protein